MIERPDSHFNFWKIMVVLARRRLFIAGFVGLATVTAVVVALLLPKWYRAKTSILPSQFDQNIGLTGNFVQYTRSSAGFELPIMATPSDVYASMLKSEAVGRGVIEAEKLQSHYRISSFQECLVYLNEQTRVTVTPEGIVELYFEDKDPAFAARIANRFVIELDSLNRRVKVAKAASDRKFVAERLAACAVDLDSARSRLSAFQTTHKALDLAKQRDLAIGAAVELKSKLALTEVALEVKGKILSPDNPEIVTLRNEAAELRRQIGGLEEGGGTGGYLGLPLAQIPGLMIRYAELQAVVIQQEKVHELLTGLYEEARIKEQKDTPTIAVLETAYPPEIKYRPKRTIIVVVTAAGSLLAAIFLSLFADYLENLRRTSPADYELLARARGEISGKREYLDS